MGGLGWHAKESQTGPHEGIDKVCLFVCFGQGNKELALYKDQQLQNSTLQQADTLLKMKYVKRRLKNQMAAL